MSYLTRVDLGVLTTVISAELVDEVIDRSGCRERRHRRLPARVVMYFVLGLCLFSASDGFCPPGYRTVIRTLSGRWRAMLANVGEVTSSALTQARQRLGAKPLQMLFEQLCGPTTNRPERWSHAFGRRVVAWDGTTIAVPDSPDNAAAFGHANVGQGTDAITDGSPAGKRGGAAAGANPLVRMMTLIECGSRALIDVAFDGIGRASEHALARGLLASLTPGMLLLADRNFLGYPLWDAALATGADLLWRAKSNTYLVPTKHLPDGSYLAILPTPAESRRLGQVRRSHKRNDTPREGHLIRVIEFTITVHTNDTTRTESYRLATTLHDHHQAPAEQLAALYHQRWESENSNNELKPRLIGSATTLRSRTPDGITQELYAFLCIYQALTTLRIDAATTAKLDPDRISFLITAREIRADIAEHSTHQPTTRKRTVIKQMIENLLGPRRQRTSPRQRIPHPNKYPAKRRDQPRPSTKTRTHITINPARSLN